MNWATVIVLLIVLTFVVLAVKAMRGGKGSCSCNENAKKSGNYSKCAGCSADCPFKR